MERIPESKYVDNESFSNLFKYARNSYKYLWAYGILKEVSKSKRIIEFETIVKRIFSKSWRPILQFNLSFGKMDKIKESIKKIQSKYEIPTNIENDRQIFNILEDINDDYISDVINSYYSSLPYTFLSPFYGEVKGMKTYNKIKKIIELSNSKEKGIYSINDDNKKIKVRKKWYKYLNNNQFKIEQWIIENFKNYLKSKNSNKTEEIDKLYKNQDKTLKYMNRSLFEILKSVFKKLWKLIFD